MAALTTTMLSVAISANTVTAVTINPAEDTIHDYMEFCIPRYLTAQQIQTNETVEYSTPVELYNFENGELIGSEVFVFDGGELIGKIDLYPTDDGYSSVFDTGITDKIAEAYSENINIALGYYDDGLWLYSENDGFVYVEGMKNSVPEITPSNLSKIITSGSIDNVTYNSVDAARSAGSVFLNVNHVDNSSNKDEDGQCSEACVAMVINYHYHLSLTADDVWSDLEDDSLSSEAPYQALQHYGYMPTYANTAMSADSVYKTLKNDKPIIASLKSENPGGHAVVICGITIDGNFSTYSIDDPNEDKVQSFIINAKPNVVNSSITYDGTNYVKWYRYAY